MAPRPQSAASRARRAQERLRMCGGGDTLPVVLTSHEAIACLGRAWFHHLLRCNALPGVQVIRFGVWRCARETFLAWLAEVANEDTLLARDTAGTSARNAGVVRTTARTRRRSVAMCEQRNNAGAEEHWNVAAAFKSCARDGGAQCAQQSPRARNAGQRRADMPQ